MLHTTTPVSYECSSRNVDIPSFQQSVLEHGYAVVRSRNNTLDDFYAFSNQMGRDFVIQGKEVGKQRIIGGNSGRYTIPNYPGLFIETAPEQRHAAHLHGEFYFHHGNPPQVLWAYCHIAGSDPGIFQLCDGVNLFKALPPTIQTFLKTHQITYVRRHSKETWQELYQTDDLQELNVFLQKESIACTVFPDQSIETRFTGPPLRKHGGEWSFINAICSFGFRQVFSPETTQARIYLENGELFPQDIFLEIWEMAQHLTIEWEWQQGDIILVDNTRVLHGRKEITVPGRQILVRFSMASFLDPVAPR